MCEGHVLLRKDYGFGSAMPRRKKGFPTETEGPSRSRGGGRGGGEGGRGGRGGIYLAGVSIKGLKAACLHPGVSNHLEHSEGLIQP